MGSKCSILVTTCDGYSDAWYPFFRLMEINWPDCKFPIYMNTESKDFSYKGLDITCLHLENDIEKKKNVSWSKRLKQALQRIDSDYIIFLLEDFFFKQKVRSEMIDECIRWMDEDNKVGFIDFYHDPYENEEIIRGEFSRIKQEFDWAINANCALWRKKFLEDLLRDEDPWNFEMNATARWRRTNYKIYTHRKEFSPVFDYQFETINGEWSGIIKGKWLTSVPKLFEQYGIEVDYSIRGFIDPPDFRPRVREEHWLWNDVMKAIKNPKLFFHYGMCVINVSKDKLRRFWRKYLNR